MRFSRIIVGIVFTVFITLFASISFAKAKNHDGEIIAYMQAIDKSEIVAGNVAKDKKVSDEVIKFAEMMIEQHDENLQQITDLSLKINIEPEETTAVKKFIEKNKKDLDKTSKSDGIKFQKAY